MNFNIDQKNEMFIRELMNKDSFMFDWYAGAVIPKHHPRYYDGRIEVNIRKVFNSSYGNINFGRDEYQVNDEVVNNLYNYIETNIDKLIKISLNQSTEMYVGVSDSLRIKYKSIYISISEINAISDKEKEEIRNIKEDLKAILITKKEKRLESITFIDAKKIADEKAKEFNKEVVGISENDEYWLFNADNEHHPIDDGAGSCYISKIDGSIRTLNRWDMEFTKKFDETAKDLLVRTSLSDLYGYHSKNNITNEKSALEYIDNISNAFLKYSFNSDDNFILLGRKKSIYDEINEILSGTKKVDNPIYFVLGSLEEFICNNNVIYISDGEKWEKGWEDLRKKNDTYSFENIICLEEKNVIEDIINKIKDYIDNKLANINDKSREVKMDNEFTQEEIEKMEVEVKNIVNKIAKLDNDSELRIGQFFEMQNLTTNEMFYLVMRVLEMCKDNGIILVEKMPDADIGLPWNCPRIKKDNRKALQMNIEEKKEIAKRIYKELGFETDNFQIEKNEEINADIFLPTDNQRGLGGIIIGDDGRYLTCGSAYSLSKYIDDFKNGVDDYTISPEVYEKTFEKDSEGKFIRLNIPIDYLKKLGFNVSENLNLIGKREEDLTKEELNMLEANKKYLESRINKSLKLSNGKYAENQETKEVFEGYMSKVDKYNEQIANGEKPDVKMGDLLNEYTDTFYDESLEEKMKKTEEDFNNKEKDTKIDDLVDSINEKLKDTEPPKFLKCPICGENLMYMEPDAITLYCRKCNKYFKNNNGTVGEEASYPYTDPKAEY